MTKLLYEEFSYKIIGAAKEVYKELGPGFLESVYEDALCYEFEQIELDYKRQVELDVTYKTKIFKNRFKADLIVNNKIIVENKAIKNITKADEAQLINYLKTTGIKLGLLFNFGFNKFELLRRVF